MTVRLERAIRSLDGVARVHVNRWGDGSAHLHLWFLARPYRAAPAARLVPLSMGRHPAADPRGPVAGEPRARRGLARRVRWPPAGRAAPYRVAGARDDRGVRGDRRPRPLLRRRAASPSTVLRRPARPERPAGATGSAEASCERSTRRRTRARAEYGRRERGTGRGSDLTHRSRRHPARTHPPADVSRETARRLRTELRAVLLSGAGQPRATARWTRVARSLPKSSPAACTASGSSDVSVIPGETLTSSTCGVPVLVDDQVHPGQVAQAERGVRGDGRLGDPLGDLGVESGRRVPGGEAGGVAGGVVVHAVLRDDLDGRQRRSAPRQGRRPRPRRPSRARTARRAPSGRTRSSRPSRPAASPASRTTAAPRPGPALRRLHHQRQPEPVDDPVEHRDRTQLGEPVVRQRHPVRRRDAGLAEHRLGGGLVPGEPGRSARRSRRRARRTGRARRAGSRPRRWRRAARS